MHRSQRTVPAGPQSRARRLQGDHLERQDERGGQGGECALSFGLHHLVLVHDESTALTIPPVHSTRALASSSSSPRSTTRTRSTSSPESRLRSTTRTSTVGRLLRLTAFECALTRPPRRRRQEGAPRAPRGDGRARRVAARRRKKEETCAESVNSL